MIPANQKIVPYLWFDNQAEEAVLFYTSLFKNSGIKSKSYYSKEGFEIHGKSKHAIMDLVFELEGQEFAALNGGPHFKFTPAISFYVTCDTLKEVDKLWQKLLEGGVVLMPLDKYEWSDKYGWVQDKFGLSWQISYSRVAVVGQKITPCLLFSDEQAGRASKAIYLYTSIFRKTHIDSFLLYGKGEPQPEGFVKHAQFSLNSMKFMVMDSGLKHGFTFNEALSFLLLCETQEEVDYFWELLGEGGNPETQQCGWLKDKFGVSWQVVPKVLMKMLKDSNAEKVNRVTAAMLKMKKLEIAGLRKAFDGK